MDYVFVPIFLPHVYLLSSYCAQPCAGHQAVVACVAVYCLGWRRRLGSSSQLRDLRVAESMCSCAAPAGGFAAFPGASPSLRAQFRGPGGWGKIAEMREAMRGESKGRLSFGIC